MEPSKQTGDCKVNLKRARELAAEFAAALRELLGQRLRRMRLYGSGARGDWSAESDLDILVLLDRVTSEDTESIVGTAFSMGVLRHGVLIQPLIMSQAEFERIKRQERRLALEIERQGLDL
jgi:predicted nucleotidyltransferase